MAEKETGTNKSATAKTSVKVTSKTADPAAKKETVKTTATAKPAAPKTATAAKPAATPAKTAKAKTTATAKTTVTAKPAATTVKTTETAKTTAAAPAVTKPAAAKPASVPEKTATTAKTTATAKTAAPKTAATAKPAATPAKTATSAAMAETAVTEPKSEPKTTAKPAKSSVQTKAADTEIKKAESKKTVSGEKSAKKSGGSGISLTAVQKDRLIFYGIIGLALIMVLCLILGIVFGSRSCTGMNWVLGQDPVNANPYKQTTMVGYSSETVGTVRRNKPVQDIHDEREFFPLGIDVAEDARYPKYGYTMSSVVGSDPDGSKAAARTVLINESDYLTAYGTHNNSGNGNNGAGTYNKMDKDGYLYFVNNGTTTPATYDNGTHRQLYKHTASVGLYLGDVSDDEPGIIKQVTLRPRGYSSYSVTGVYAPAGEVIKIELSDADMTATGGITIHIGQALYNGQSNNIWTAKGQMQRFPNILNTMVVNKSTAEFNEETGIWTAYVGSFIGGPLYVRNTSATVSLTISGGVAYRHFILGSTTAEEFAKLSESSVPYFDLEVWDRGVLHSGPLTYAKTFSYDDLYKAAVLWEKVSIVANANGIGTNCYNQGIVFLYDPFVAAGAAVAFPGRSSVNCPMGWMSSSLNYTATVTSGSWGNFHEYHHNFQNYGVGYTGEVTNNGLNLVAYSLFTNISSARQMSSYGGAGLSGWNCYTSATWAQQQVKANNINSTSGLAVYSTLLHNFGQEAFLKARGYTGARYWNRYQDVTHYDFSYFDQNTTRYSGGVLGTAENEYPLFVPVSSVYQTGRTYLYDGEKRESTTMRPYVIPYGQPFTVDLRPYTMNVSNQYESGSVFIGASTHNDFTYKIKDVNSDGINGTFVKAGEDGLYTFTPNGEIRSGKIYVTLEIYNAADGTREWNGHKLDDVDLILEFQQSHEWNKAILERTTYVYDADNMPTSQEDLEAEFESGFSGSVSAVEQDNKNKSQNSNADVWLYPYARYKDDASVSDYLMTPNSIVEVKGKLYFPEEGIYRIYLRGRIECALYISRDNGKTYSKEAYYDTTMNTARNDQFYPNDERTYVDVKVVAEEWIYFKEVVIVEDLGGKASYVGLGIGSWTVPQYTTVEKHYDANGNEVSSTDDPNYDHSVTHYYKGNQEVSAEEANDTTPVAPTSITYATAYRQDYEFQREFESDYFFTRPYSYNYQDNFTVPFDEVTVTETNYTATGYGSGMPITNLSDGKTNTYIHTSWQVTESKPLNLTFDLGSERTINRISFYCRNSNGMLETPKAFTVEGSLDGETWFDVAAFTEAPRNGHYVIVDFEDATMKYCRISISQTHQGSGKYYVVIGEITFMHIYEILGGKLYSPDNAMFTYKGNWQTVSCNANFGHVYVGKDATMEFEFEGTKLGLIASKYYGQNYEILIDGELVQSVEVKEDNGDYSLVFLSPELEEGKHSVVIYLPQEGNIDSVVFW